MDGRNKNSRKGSKTSPKGHEKQKAARPDNITIEMLQMAGDNRIQKITELINLIYEQ